MIEHFEGTWNYETMKRYTIVFLNLLFWGISQNISFSSSLSGSLSTALKRNPSLQTMELKIQQAKLGFEERTVGRLDTPLKKIDRELFLLDLENQRQDISDSIDYQVHHLYYENIIQAKAVELAKKDMDYGKEYLEEVDKNFREGRVERREYRSAVESLNQKQENFILRSSDKQNFYLNFLLVLNLPLSESIRITGRIDQTSSIRSIEFYRKKLRDNNRRIQKARLQFELKELENESLVPAIQSQYEVQKSELALQVAKLEFDEQVRKEEVELWKRYLTVSDKESRVKTAEQRLKRQEEIYAIEKENFAKGYIASFQKNLFHMAYLQAELSHLRALKELQLALRNLEYLLN